MQALLRFYQSSIGKKIVVAVTGVMLIGFVMIHMLGNFSIYLGQDAINTYALKLKSTGPILWIFRIGLLVVFALHIINTIQLARMNRKARPENYRKNNKIQASRASLSMVLSGSVVLAFLIYHLLHFTVGATDPKYLDLHDAQGRHDVYSMVVMAFQKPLVSGFYILAMALLCMHLSHGFASAFQTVGVRNPTLAPYLKYASIGLAGLIFIGNSSIPLAVLLGFLKLPQI